MNAIDDHDLDALLRADAAQGVPDDGFSRAVLRRLPRRHRRRNALPARAAQLLAISLAVLALGGLPEGGESLLPALSLLALLLWWSLPQSGGALYRGA